MRRVARREGGHLHCRLHGRRYREMMVRPILLIGGHWGWKRLSFLRRKLLTKYRRWNAHFVVVDGWEGAFLTDERTRWTEWIVLGWWKGGCIKKEGGIGSGGSSKDVVG